MKRSDYHKSLSFVCFSCQYACDITLFAIVFVLECSFDRRIRTDLIKHHNNQKVGSANATNPQDTQTEGHRVSAFSFGEDKKKVQWGSRTLGLNMMRTFSTGMVLGIVVLAISLGSGCGNGGDGGNDVDSGKSADNNAVGGLAGDDGVVAGRISFIFDGNQYDGTTCIANSFPGENSTSITSGGDEGEWTLMLEIPGMATGQFDEEAGATCSFVKPPFDNYDSEAVTIVVSGYGKVGGAVEGTFSGMLTSQLDSTRKPITEGIFTAQRHLNVK